MSSGESTAAAPASASPAEPVYRTLLERATTRVVNEPHGLVDNAFVKYKAEEVRQFKEGRMLSLKICGVLVGKHEHDFSSRAGGHAVHSRRRSRLGTV
eukprot:4053874-Pleurochrysis_carterae.AAC.3